MPSVTLAADHQPEAGAPPSVSGPVPSSAVRAAVPDALVNLPFARHLAAAGATLLDLGVSHGVHGIAATASGQFMVFQMTEDGSAAVSGTMAELSVAQLVSIAGVGVSDIGTLHGLRGLYVRSGASFQIFYVTPDGERVIPGILWDASGTDLTRTQVAAIPGVVPTVVVGDAPAPDPTGSKGLAPSAAALPLVQKANAGTVGVSSAPHLWMLIDPQCIYSVRAYQMLRPYVDAGRLQLSVIPLSVLDYEDHGESTRAALALLSKPGDQLVTAWRAGSVSDPPVPEASDRLRANMAIAEAIHLTGTPTLIWRKPDGSEGRIDGIPTSVQALVASVGG